MNAFVDTCRIERESISILMPFLDHKADGRVVLTHKGILARHLQETVGDALFNLPDGTIWGVEFKAEKENKHGNFFLETWSNKNLDNRKTHSERGSNPGWMMKLRADLLFYHFIESDELYIINFFRLKQWAFGCSGMAPNIYKFDERKQSKYLQHNDTWGRCVPIHIIAQTIGYRLIHPKKLINIYSQICYSDRRAADGGAGIGF